jgi:hypothetical protein
MPPSPSVTTKPLKWTAASCEHFIHLSSISGFSLPFTCSFIYREHNGPLLPRGGCALIRVKNPVGTGTNSEVTGPIGPDR